MSADPVLTGAVVEDVIVGELLDRSGFDAWWDDMDPDVRLELRAALDAAAARVLASVAEADRG